MAETTAPGVAPRPLDVPAVFKEAGATGIVESPVNKIIY